MAASASGGGSADEGVLGVGGADGGAATRRATASRRRVLVTWLRQWRRMLEFTLNLRLQPGYGHWNAVDGVSYSIATVAVYFKHDQSSQCD